MTSIRNTFVVSTALLLGLSLSSAFAQKEGGAPNKKDVYAELAKAPKKAASRRNPLENDPEAVAAGANLFAQHCALQ